MKKNVIGSLLFSLILSLPCSALAEESQDIFTIVEQSLQTIQPLSTLTEAKQQKNYFSLYRFLMLSDREAHASNLLKSLDYQSNLGKALVQDAAQWLASEGSPDKGLIVLSEVGLKQPVSSFQYTNFVHGWIKKGQPEKALSLLSGDRMAMNYLLSDVLNAYKTDPEKAEAIYQSNYGDRTIDAYYQVNMLLSIAQSYQLANNDAKATEYAKKTEDMILEAIKEKGGDKNGELFPQQYVALSSLYTELGNISQAIKIADHLTEISGGKGYYYDQLLPVIMKIYRENQGQKQYKAILDRKISEVNKQLSFKPDYLAEGKLIDLLFSINEPVLAQQRLDILMNAPEYSCFEVSNCYERKINNISQLQKNQPILAEKLLRKLVAEAKAQSFVCWEIATKYMVKELVKNGMLAEAKSLAQNAEKSYDLTFNALPQAKKEYYYRALVEIYSAAKDFDNATRVIQTYMSKAKDQNAILVNLYLDNQEWQKAMEIYNHNNDDWQDLTNNRLLKGLCDTPSKSCQKHITLTLQDILATPVLATQANIERIYQIGLIYSVLKISPDQEQQLLINKLVQKAVQPKNGVSSQSR